MEQRKLHLGFVLSALEAGGAESSMLRLGGALIERGHRVDLLLLRPSIHYRRIPNKLRLYYLRGRKPHGDIFAGAKGGAAATPLWIGPLSILRGRRELARRYPNLRLGLGNARDILGVARYARAAKPALLLSALPRADTAAAAGARLEGVPAVISIHIDVAADYDNLKLLRAKKLYREAAAIVAVSRGAAAEAVRSLGLDEARVHAVYNGIPVAEIRRLSREAISHPWFADGEPPVVMTVGRGAPQKDHAALVEAFGRVRRSAAARLLIMGRSSAAYRGNLLAAARRFAVERDVSFLDFDENPFRYMSRAAVFVLSSRWEGLPTVLLEAMACGAPVVSTDAPSGPAEILDGGRWGALTPVGDPAALARAIAHVLAGNRVPADRLRQRAEEFDTLRAAARYEELFAEVAAAWSRNAAQPLTPNP